MATDRLCSIPGCGKPQVARGYCGGHYMRWRRHGDPLSGGTAHGEPERFYREVVLPYGGQSCLFWPYGKAGKGYAKMRVDGKEDYVHRRLCEETHGQAPTPDHEVAHSCGRGFDACVTKRHLSWKTPAENQADKLDHGTHRSGEQINFAKLKEPEVRKIFALRGKMLQREIADIFGVSQTLVSQIHRRVIWARLT